MTTAPLRACITTIHSGDCNVCSFNFSWRRPTYGWIYGQIFCVESLRRQAIWHWLCWHWSWLWFHCITISGLLIPCSAEPTKPVTGKSTGLIAASLQYYLLLHWQRVLRRTGLWICSSKSRVESRESRVKKHFINFLNTSRTLLLTIDANYWLLSWVASHNSITFRWAQREYANSFLWSRIIIAIG